MSFRLLLQWQKKFAAASPDFSVTLSFRNVCWLKHLFAYYYHFYVENSLKTMWLILTKYW